MPVQAGKTWGNVSEGEGEKNAALENLPILTCNPSN